MCLELDFKHLLMHNEPTMLNPPFIVTEAHFVKQLFSETRVALNVNVKFSIAKSQNQFKPTISKKSFKKYFQIV